MVRVRAVANAYFAEMENGFAKHRPATGSQGLEKQAARRQGTAEKPGSTPGDLAGLKGVDRYLRRVHAKRDRAVRLALEHPIHSEINSQ